MSHTYPGEKETRLLLHLAAELGISHMVLVLGESQENFHINFKRSLGRPVSVPLRKQCVKMKLRSQREKGLYKFGEAKNVDCLRKIARSGALLA